MNKTWALAILMVGAFQANAGVKCQTKSNGANFTSESLTNKIAKDQVVAQCKNSWKSYPDECEKNAFCDGEKEPTQKTCSTYTYKYVNASPLNQIESAPFEYLTQNSIKTEESLSRYLLQKWCEGSESCLSNIHCDGDMNENEYVCISADSTLNGYKLKGRSLEKTAWRVYIACKQNSYDSTNCRQYLTCKDQKDQIQSAEHLFKILEIGAAGVTDLQSFNTNKVYGGDLSIKLDLARVNNVEILDFGLDAKVLVDQQGNVSWTGKFDSDISGVPNFLIKPMKVTITEASGEANLGYMGYYIKTDDAEFKVAISPIGAFGGIQNTFGITSSLYTGGKLKIGALELSTNHNASVIWALGKGEIKEETSSDNGSVVTTITNMPDGSIVKTEVYSTTKTTTKKGSTTSLVQPGFKVTGDFKLGINITPSSTLFGAIDYSVEGYQLKTEYPDKSKNSSINQFQWSAKPSIGVNLKL